MPNANIPAPDSSSAVDRLSLTASSVREVTPLTGANCVCGCPCFEAEASNMQFPSYCFDAETSTHNYAADWCFAGE